MQKFKASVCLIEYGPEDKGIYCHLCNYDKERNYRLLAMHGVKHTPLDSLVCVSIYRDLEDPTHPNLLVTKKQIRSALVKIPCKSVKELSVQRLSWTREFCTNAYQDLLNYFGEVNFVLPIAIPAKLFVGKDFGDTIELPCNIHDKPAMLELTWTRPILGYEGVKTARDLLKFLAATPVARLQVDQLMLIEHWFKYIIEQDPHITHEECLNKLLSHLGAYC